MDTSLIAKYLAGESNNREKKKVEQWLQVDPKNHELMKEFKRIWEASGKGNEQFQNHFDPTEDWEQLRHRILRENGNHEAVHSSDFHLYKSYSRTNKSYSAQILRVAVIILVASLLGVLSYEHLYQQLEVAEPTLREISMDKGQRGNITLSDGTQVTLNAESKIILPKVFESEKREVTLEGEAFFNVSHNSARPFIIYTEAAVVEVLGTSLDIRSYPEDSSVQVVVKEGQVSLRSKRECADGNTILNAGEMGQLFISNSQIEKKKVEDYDLFLGWRNGFLKFKDAPMGKVAEELERKYDIEIRFDDPKLKDLRLTAELKSRTIPHNMDVITTSLGMEYKIDQQVVTFY